MPSPELEQQITSEREQATSSVPRTKMPDGLTVLKAYGLRPSGLPRKNAGIPPTSQVPLEPRQ